MTNFQNAKWIWINDRTEKDVYGEFFATFSTQQPNAICRLSCSGDYTLFINGQYVASNQYGDFEHYKVYDEVDLTPFLCKGENRIDILVWHFGEDFSRHYASKAGLLFEVAQGENILLSSDEHTLCRKSPVYKNGYQKWLTPQFGYSFLYDATKENADVPFAPAVLADKSCKLFARPNRRLQILDRVETELLKEDGTYFLIDLGAETVGLPELEFDSATEQTILVAFGEDLQADGHVRRILPPRDFSFEYVAKTGHNHYINYMMRLGCRYLEVYAKEPITLQYAGLLPQVYPATVKPFRLADLLDQRIYDLCVQTLKLCMMEHYVDCPWREQCLYAFDSRNQMLCGYYAFEDGNAEYARSNLKLIAEDCRTDGLLAICSPSGKDFTIPSFSLYFFMAVREYVEHTGDTAFAKEVYPKLCDILSAFLKNRKNGLAYAFEGANRWNFYDWSPYLDGTSEASKRHAPDLMINALLVNALENLRCIDHALGNTFAYAAELEETRSAARAAFYNQEKGCFSLTEGGDEFTVLANAFAVLTGIAEEQDKERLCVAMTDGSLIDCSLSMKTFKYDALLMVNEEKWKGQVRDEIHADYKKMLDAGATATWETIDGAEAFDNAGSLCHGWTAIPVYYYHKYFS